MIARLLGSYLIPVAAGGLLLLVGLAAVWHLSAVHAAYARGELSERLKWQDQQAREAAKRAAEKAAAQAALQDMEKRLAAAEDADDAEKEKLRDDLERALAADAAGLDRCSIPGGVLGPHRSLH